MFTRRRSTGVPDQPVNEPESRNEGTETIAMRVLTVVTALVLLTGCSTGSDAVVPGAQFEFVAPGGKTELFYNPPSQRGTVQNFSGESVMQPDKQISLSDFAGKVVVLNIWGTWCGPCRHEMPELQRVHEKTYDEGVRLLGIDVRDYARWAPADFLTDRGITYPSIYDPPGRTLLSLQNFPRNIVPVTIVLDRNHRVAAIFLKPLLEEDLLPVVRRIAAEPTPARTT